MVKEGSAEYHNVSWGFNADDLSMYEPIIGTTHVLIIYPKGVLL